MEITITLSADDSERLFAIKQLQGEADRTADEFMDKLIHKTLFKMFPAIPQRDEVGNILNAHCYRPK